MDASYVGPVADFARAIYEVVATNANQLESKFPLEGFTSPRSRCQIAQALLEETPPNESADSRRRRHLVAGACLLLINKDDTVTALDQARSLLEQALVPEGTGVPSVRREPS
jgi:hypothetical protein